MEQHAVPQNISSYEFRLVGDMTLKQFFQLAGGIVIGLVIFRLPLPGLIKYPLVGLSVLVGILMAFVPVNGRPFTQWIVAFIKAIYSPTQYYWVATEIPPAHVTTPLTSVSIPSTAPAPIPPPKPKLPPEPSLESFKRVTTAPISLNPTPVNPAPATPTITTYGQATKPTPAAPPPPPPAPAPSQPTPPPTPLSSSVAEKDIAGPRPTATSDVVFNAPQVAINAPAPMSPQAQATTTTLIDPPTTANILAGVVTDAAGSQTLDGVIVEIINSQTGIPARALRTNRLGQFQIATPLPTGSYSVLAEKDNFTFDPVAINVHNALIPPVIIKAKPA